MIDFNLFRNLTKLNQDFLNEFLFKPFTRSDIVQGHSVSLEAGCQEFRVRTPILNFKAGLTNRLMDSAGRKDPRRRNEIVSHFTHEP